MKLTVLGCWAPYPAPNQACSGYLLEAAGKRILIDLGHGAFGKLGAICDLRQVSAVFISHLHPDHCADLCCLRHWVLGARRQGEKVCLPLYTPCEPEDKFQVLADFGDAFDIHIIGTESLSTLDIAGMKCEIFRTVHPVPTCGLSVEEEGKKFVYTSDTAWKDTLVDFCSRSDLLLCEASLSEADSHLAEKGHLTVAQAGRLASEAAAGKLILTHFWPGYVLDDLKEEVSHVYKGEFEMAGEFMEVLI